MRRKARWTGLLAHQRGAGTNAPSRDGGRLQHYAEERGCGCVRFSSRRPWFGTETVWVFAIATLARRRCIFVVLLRGGMPFSAVLGSRILSSIHTTSIRA